MKSKWSTSDRATLRAAYIGLIGVILAAVIGALIAVYLAGGSSGVNHSGAEGSPTATPPTSNTPSHSTPSTVAPTAGSTWTETTFTESKTFADYLNAGYPLGAPLSPRQAVKVSCRVRGFIVKDRDPWWYRLASPPWNGRYYATSDVFYNTPSASGNPINGVIVDKRVPLC